MLSFICYMVPGVIAAQIVSKFGKKLEWKEFAVHSMIYAFIILIFNYLVLAYLFGNSNEIIKINSESVIFIVKYLVMSLVWTCILPFIEVKIAPGFHLRVGETPASIGGEQQVSPGHDGQASAEMQSSDGIAEEQEISL